MVMGSLRQEIDTVVIGSGPGGYVAALQARRPRQGGAAGRGARARRRHLPARGLHPLEDADPRGRGEGGGARRRALRPRRRGLDLRPRAAARLDRGGGRRPVRRRRRPAASGAACRSLRGRARFSSSHSLEIEGGEVSGIDFQHCIIATGSSLAVAARRHHARRLVQRRRPQAAARARHACSWSAAATSASSSAWSTRASAARSRWPSSSRAC